MKNVIKKVILAFVVIVLLGWGAININRNSFFFIWGILAVGGVAGMVKIIIKGYRPINRWLNISFSLLFSVIVVAGNTPLGNFLNLPGGIGKVLLLVIEALGGFIAFSGVLAFSEQLSLKCESAKHKSLAFFIVPFVAISIINILVLILCRFPGIIDEDGKVVLSQIYGVNPYTNHHSIFYTMLLQVFLRLINSPNTAVFLFCMLQILFVASCMSYSVYTLNELGFSWKVCGVVCAVYALYPMFVDYSFFVSKDIPFACFMLLAAVFFTRVILIKNVKHVYYVLLAISLVGLGIFRSNGVFVLLLTSLFAIILWRKNKLLVTALVVAMVVTILMKRGIPAVTGVSQPDTLETLAIPLQQVTRVCVDNPQSLTEEDVDLISAVVDMDSVLESYNSEWVDFTKEAIRKKGNLKFLDDNKLEYLKMYIRLGIKNPGAYVKAWICQTRGYWFTKESFSITYPGIVPNEWGIYNRPLIPSAEKAYNDLFAKILNNPIAQHLTCIAIFAWTNIVYIYIYLYARGKNKLFCFQ